MRLHHRNIGSRARPAHCARVRRGDVLSSTSSPASCTTASTGRASTTFRSLARSARPSSTTTRTRPSSGAPTSGAASPRSASSSTYRTRCRSRLHVPQGPRAAHFSGTAPLARRSGRWWASSVTRAHKPPTVRSRFERFMQRIGFTWTPTPPERPPQPQVGFQEQFCELGWMDPTFDAMARAPRRRQPLFGACSHWRSRTSTRGASASSRWCWRGRGHDEGRALRVLRARSISGSYAA